MPDRWKTTERPPDAWRADWLFAIGVMALSFGTYVATLYPGLGGGGDAAKFRFLGHVLGTAHPPGYPLYVVLSWLFSILPIGTLAYRINLMSAACAALAAGATYGSARALGARRMAGLAAGLGLGFGRAFWSKAVVAEVYALAAVLIAATVWALLVWRRTGRTRWLLGAVAFASLAFGNHLTVAFAVPAFVAFALLHDARGCLRPRILAACVAIVALGICSTGSSSFGPGSMRPTWNRPRATCANCGTC